MHYLTKLYLKFIESCVYTTKNSQYNYVFIQQIVAVKDLYTWLYIKPCPLSCDLFSVCVTIENIIVNNK